MSKTVHLISTLLQFTGVLSTQTPLKPPSTSNITADIIIIGAGTTGLLLANRLSTNPHLSILLIDPGPDIRNNSNITSISHWQSNLFTDVDWTYETVPQPHAANRTLIQHAGKLVGGTSMINGMAYVRSDSAVIDAWELLGATGWNWSTLYPFYKTVEHFDRPSEAQKDAGARYNKAFHGMTGDMHVGWPFGLAWRKVYDSVSKTWENLGISTRPDPNGGEVGGFTVRPMMVRRDEGVRESSATAFYYPIADRKNLRLIRGTVTQLHLISTKGGDQKATGVEYVNPDGDMHTADVTRRGEVVLSAGTYRTPLILEASGIGDPQVLDELGIDVKINLPGVGKNLQEQPHVGLVYESKQNVTGFTPYATFLTAEDIFGNQTEEIKAKTAALVPSWAQTIVSTGGAVSTDAISRILHIQHALLFTPRISIGQITTSLSKTHISSQTTPLFQFSRGTIHLLSRHPTATNTPLINPNIYTLDTDTETHIAITRLAAKFYTTAPMSGNVMRRTKPSMEQLPRNASYAQVMTFLKQNAVPSQHPVGTAAMMSRSLGGVVDPELRVYGTKNVRVLDASVVPLQVNGHLVATLYAVAERGAGMILEGFGEGVVGR